MAQQQQQQGQPQAQGIPAASPLPMAGQQVTQNQNVARKISNCCMELKMAHVAPHVRTFWGKAIKSLLIG